MIRERRTIERTCLHCGKPFSVDEHYLKVRLRHDGARACSFCSMRCGFDYKRARNFEIRECGWCHGQFRYMLWYKGLPTNTGKFCSVECKNEDSRSRRPKHTCKACGREFSAPKSANRKYCSQKCYGKLPSSVSVQCVVCGNAYTVNRARLEITKCCSLNCAAEYFRETKRKSSSEERRARCGTKAWKRVRNSVVKRDGGRCAVCGSSEILAVHHRIPWLTCREDNPENLITLCKSCHYKVEFIRPTLLEEVGA